MSKDAMNSKRDGMYSPEPQLSASESCKLFLYNPSTGAFLGRTGSSWVKILIFYIIFYIVLALLFGLCTWLFMKTLSEDGPKYYLDESLIGTSPGLGFRPMSKENEESTLIWYNSTAKNNHKNWTMGLEEFLEKYDNHTSGKNVIKCDYDKGPHKGDVCAVELDKWFPCTVKNEFDYPRSKPCVFIKLNKILNWIPDYYNETNKLPTNMPKDLKKHIADRGKINKKLLNTVWVSCEGENPADKENIGVVEYIPHRGFPGYYYPFTKVDNYRSPLVAVHFKSIAKNVLVNVECKAWARNILHDRRDRVGMVHFELMVD